MRCYLLALLKDGLNFSPARERGHLFSNHIIEELLEGLNT